jgi:hypothetical protein
MSLSLPYTISEGDTTSNTKIEENFRHLESKINNEPLSIVSYADADAPVSTLYYSTTQSKLVWKDAGSVVRNLY